MAKRKAPGWAGFPAGAGLSLLLYILFQCLIALLTMKGHLPEAGVFRVQVGSALVAACAGGSLAVRYTGVGSLLAALGSSGMFAGIMVLGGMLVWNGVVWSAEAILLLSAALLGGVAAGMLGSRKKKRKPTVGPRREKAGKRML